jgi:hypothetical protein
MISVASRRLRAVLPRVGRSRHGGVDDTDSGVFAPGTATKIFEGSSYAGGGDVVQARTYDVSLDGQRFLMIKLPRSVDSPTPRSVVIVQNWLEELRRLAPATSAR